MTAVPYFGTGATELLTLRAGNVLITKFDLEAIKSGQVDPKEIVKAIQREVQVHHCSNLHAKVFVFDKTAVVGSSNVSHNSENNLLEACVETTDRKVVAGARRFVRGLLGDRVGLDYAQKMIPYFRPPVRPRNGAVPAGTKKRIPTHSGMWLFSLVEGPWQDVDYEQEEKGWASAEKAIKNPRTFKVDDFKWSAGKTLSLLKIGQRIVQCIKTESGQIVVSPPSRIIGIRRYNAKKQKRAIVYLETPRTQRRRRLSAVLRNLGAIADRLGNPRRTKQLRDAELVYELGRLWA